MLKGLLIDLIFSSGFDGYVQEKQVYIYEDTGNKQYVCYPSPPHLYVEWTGYGNLLFDHCTLTNTDKATWPVVNSADDFLYELSGNVANVLSTDVCRFVATADVGAATSTVIDCRTYP